MADLLSPIQLQKSFDRESEASLVTSDPIMLFTAALERFQSTMKSGLEELRYDLREFKAALHEACDEMIQDIKKTEDSMNIESESVSMIVKCSNPISEPTEAVNSFLQNAVVLQEDLLKEPEEIDRMIPQSQVPFSFWEFRRGDNLLGSNGIEFLVADQSLGIENVKNQLLRDFQNRSHICFWMAQQNEHLCDLEAWKVAGNFKNLPKVTTTFLAHQLFDQMILRGREYQQRLLRKILKFRKFKYKLKKQHGISVASLKVIWLLVIRIVRRSMKIYTTGSSLFTAMRRSMLCLGAEIAKNLIFAGVKSVTLHDERVVGLWDLSSNFVFYEDDTGKKWADASVHKLQDLTNAVVVSSLTTSFITEHLSDFQVVVFSAISLAKSIEFNDYCYSHQSPIAFVKADVRGLFGSIFGDFGLSTMLLERQGYKAMNKYRRRMIYFSAWPCWKTKSVQVITFVKATKVTHQKYAVSLSWLLEQKTIYHGLNAFWSHVKVKCLKAHQYMREKNQGLKFIRRLSLQNQYKCWFVIWFQIEHLQSIHGSFGQSFILNGASSWSLILLEVALVVELGAVKIVGVKTDGVKVFLVWFKGTQDQFVTLKRVHQLKQSYFPCTNIQQWDILHGSLLYRMLNQLMKLFFQELAFPRVNGLSLQLVETFSATYSAYSYLLEVVETLPAIWLFKFHRRSCLQETLPFF